MQHGYLVTNIAVTGATIAFALTASDNVPSEIRAPALFCIPLMSFSLFMLWIHQAFVISHRGAYIKAHLLPDGWQAHQFKYFTRTRKAIMAFCYAAGILGVFIGMPFCAAYLGTMVEKDSISYPYPLKWMVWVVMPVSTVLFFVWFRDFYFRERISATEANKALDPTSG